MAKTNGKAGTAVAVKDNDFSVAKYRAGVVNLQKRPAAGGRAAFLRMDKDDQGRWKYGQEDNPVGPNDELYVDPNGSVYGWQCWADTELGVPAAILGSVFVPIHEPLPAKPEVVPENGREWAEMRGMSLVLRGQPLTYTTTSLGGLDAVAAFNAAFAEQLDADESKLIAVVKLSSDWYKNKKYGGKTYVPIFNVVRWVSSLPTEATAGPVRSVRTAAKAPVKSVKAKAEEMAKSAMARAKAAPAKQPVGRRAAR